MSPQCRENMKHFNFKYSFDDDSEQKQSDHVDSLLASNVFQKLRSPKMIVFDKDGTLGDCTSALRIWANTMTNYMVNELTDMEKPSNEIDECIQAFHKAMGWCSVTDNVVPSAPLAADTWESIVETAGFQLASFGITEAATKAKQWHYQEMNNVHGDDSPLFENLKDIMQYFKNAGLLVAICTSDDRTGTDACIRNWDLADVIDYSICGNEVNLGKPHAEPLTVLCQRAGCSVENCIVVGDTTSDTGMARNAGAGLCIGVLTGSGTRHQLLSGGADLILPGVNNIPQLLEVMTVRDITTTEIEVPEESSSTEIPPKISVRV